MDYIKFQSRSVFENCKGWSESILFTHALAPIFTAPGSYRFINTIDGLVLRVMSIKIRQLVFCCRILNLRFLLFYASFWQNFPDCSRSIVCDWRIRNIVALRFILFHTIWNFTDLEKEVFSENVEGKGENAGNQHFLYFPQYFPSFPKTNFNFSVTFSLSSANALNLDPSKRLSCGKELIVPN